MLLGLVFDELLSCGVDLVFAGQGRQLKALVEAYGRGECPDTEDGGIQITEGLLGDRSRELCTEATEDAVFVYDERLGRLADRGIDGLFIPGYERAKVDDFDTLAEVFLDALSDIESEVERIPVGDERSIRPLAADTCLAEGYFEVFGDDRGRLSTIVLCLGLEEDRDTA